MAENGGRVGASQSNNLGDGAAANMEENIGTASGSLDSKMEAARLKLRQRWELASVLNFMSVFEPVIGKDLKLRAEEIETALIEPNASLAKLHVELLKGIPPVNKKLSTADTWVTILCKKLAEWWPWVAEGELPLVAAKGEEILRYKELDPPVRLLMLKALCEIRADQYDVVSYINDAVKQGTQLSFFRKDNIGEVGNEICYWYDGDPTIGHRLYRETKKFDLRPKKRDQDHIVSSEFNFRWETLATNLGEFRKVLDELSPSKVGVEAAVCKTIENDIIPALEKLHKKKERALKLKQRQQAILNGYHSNAISITRSCRDRKPVSYTFDEYDRTIDEAIKLTKRGKVTEEHKRDREHKECREDDADEESENHSDVRERKPDSTDEETERDKQEVSADDDDDFDCNGDSSMNKYDKNSESDGSDPESQSGDFDKRNHAKQVSQSHTVGAVALQTRKRAANVLGVEARSPGLKNRLRQRPIRNSAIEFAVVSDSDDGFLSESTEHDASGERSPHESAGDGIPGDDSPSVAADSEDENSS